MASQYFAGNFSALLPNASVNDVTPPTFAGIASVTPNVEGSFTLSWLAASDATPPIEYNLYVALGSVSAAALFVTSNLVTISPAGSLSKKVFTLADQTTYFINGTTYTFGVRAKDAVGNINTNIAILTSTATGSGNLPAIYQTIAANLQATELLLAQDHLDLAADHVNFQSDHANFQTDHTNLAADIVALGNENVAFGLNNTDLANEIADLDAISASLEASVSSVAKLGGLTIAIADEPTLTFEIIDENGVLI